MSVQGGVALVTGGSRGIGAACARRFLQLGDKVAITYNSSTPPADLLAAGAIADALAVPQNTLSSHLAILVRAGLISSRRHSRSIVYRAELGRFQAVALYLIKDCCGGRPEICDIDVKACCAA